MCVFVCHGRVRWCLRVGGAIDCVCVYVCVVGTCVYFFAPIVARMHTRPYSGTVYTWTYKKCIPTDHALLRSTSTQTHLRAQVRKGPRRVHSEHVAVELDQPARCLRGRTSRSAATNRCRPSAVYPHTHTQVCHIGTRGSSRKPIGATAVQATCNLASLDRHNSTQRSVQPATGCEKCATCQPRTHVPTRSWALVSGGYPSSSGCSLYNFGASPSPDASTETAAVPFKFTTNTVTAPFPAGAQKAYTRTAATGASLVLGTDAAGRARVVTSDGRNLDPTRLQNSERPRNNQKRAIHPRMHACKQQREGVDAQVLSSVHGRTVVGGRARVHNDNGTATHGGVGTPTTNRLKRIVVKKSGDGVSGSAGKFPKSE
jgi:hypothetical protein